jgi:GAF domain-containing protein
MREIYGGLAAQIVTPVVLDGVVAGIVSLHQLGDPRRWTEDEIEACRRAAARVGELL